MELQDELIRTNRLICVPSSEFSSSCKGCIETRRHHPFLPEEDQKCNFCKCLEVIANRKTSTEQVVIPVSEQKVTKNDDLIMTARSMLEVRTKKRARDGSFVEQDREQTTSARDRSLTRTTTEDFKPRKRVRRANTREEVVTKKEETVNKVCLPERSHKHTKAT